MVNFSHTDPGTPEAMWVEAGVGELPPLPAEAEPGRAPMVLILSAHPDDETLGAGGLIRLALAAGARVHVIVATAGEASHPGSPGHPPERLARIRAAELEEALASLGPAGDAGAAATFELLGLPDGALAKDIPAVEAAVRAAGPGPGAILVAPYRHDGHGDHDALGSLAARLAQELGLGLLEYPIWFWHWARPDGNPAWTRWHSLALDPQTAAAKAAAMESHRSQVAPLSAAPQDAALLHGPFLRHFTRPAETYRYTPAGLRDSGTAVQVFDALYTRRPDPWHYLGSEYEERKRAITLASLPRRRYGTVLELGCSIGVLTRELAPRARSLLALDASEVALRDAAQRVADQPHVSLLRAVLPHQWPAIEPASQDLVVVSEIGYFLAADELDQLLLRCRESMSPGGQLLLCHWLHPVEGWPLDGDGVHAAARDLGLEPKLLHRETDFILEVLERPGDGDE